MGVLATTDPLHTLLLGYLSDWRTQLQTWAVSGALVNAASKALVLETVPASFRPLKRRLANGDWSDLPRVELLNGSRRECEIDHLNQSCNSFEGLEQVLPRVGSSNSIEWHTREKTDTRSEMP